MSSSSPTAPSRVAEPVAGVRQLPLPSTGAAPLTHPGAGTAPPSKAGGDHRGQATPRRPAATAVPVGSRLCHLSAAWPEDHAH